MINKTQLNKLRDLLDKNKTYLDSQPIVKADDDKKYSMAVSMSILMEYYSLNQVEALDSITDNDGDNKIDAFYYSDDESELAELVIIQSKYKLKDGETDTFSEDDIRLCIESCKKILAGDEFQTINADLEKKINNYRELLKDNEFPPISIKLFFATNGIIHSGHKSLDVVLGSYEYNITSIFVDATLFGNVQTFESGELIVNLKDPADKTDCIFDIGDKSYNGRIISCSLKELMKFYKNTGERLLLNTNVRYHIKNSSINKDIVNSFIQTPSKFCYLNNGITIICSNYEINPTGHSFSNIIFTNPSIVNGGQTIASIYNLYLNKYDEYEDQFNQAKILIRIYKTPLEYSIHIAKATNSQNPIRIVDLKANDIAQNIAKAYFSKFGIGLITKIGEDISYYDDTITNEKILQIYASLYRGDPAKAKTSKAAIFKKYYDEVFNDTIDDTMCGQLLRCYQISNYIETQIPSYDKRVIQNAFYSIIYSMKLLDPNILISEIPKNDITKLFDLIFNTAYQLMLDIIKEKEEILKSKFSMNNLFKNNEIKILIDLKLE